MDTKNQVEFKKLAEKKQMQKPPLNRNKLQAQKVKLLRGDAVRVQED